MLIQWLTFWTLYFYLKQCFIDWTLSLFTDKKPTQLPLSLETWTNSVNRAQLNGLFA